MFICIIAFVFGAYVQMPNVLTGWPKVLLKEQCQHGKEVCITILD